MARKLRVEYPGALYHVMNRGDRREAIIKDDKDRGLFLETLAQACVKTGWQVHAYCLMPNHFHLVVETPQANLVAGMKWFLGTYTGRFNRRHKLFGHLFSGRYKSLVVDGSGDGYLKTVCDYMHLNPVRAKMIAPGQKLAAYRWSSYRWYVMPALHHAPNRLDTNMFKRIMLRRTSINGCHVGHRTKSLACSLYKRLISKAMKIALYHTLGKLSEPEEFTHRFC